MFKKFLIPLFLLLAVGFGFWNLKSRDQKNSIPNEKVVRDFKANLTINDGVNTIFFDASQYVGKTILETTQNITDGKIITVGTGANSLVTSINGRLADTTKREFWELIINGLSSKVWAGNYSIKDGDQIEWHLNKRND